MTKLPDRSSESVFIQYFPDLSFGGLTLAVEVCLHVLINTSAQSIPGLHTGSLPDEPLHLFGIASLDGIQ